MRQADPCLSGRGRAAFFEPRAFGDGQTGVADQRVVPLGACAPEVDGAPPRLVELRVAAVSAQPRRRAKSKARIVRRLFSHITKDRNWWPAAPRRPIVPSGPGRRGQSRSRDTSRLNHDRAGGILIRAKALAFRPRPHWGASSARVGGRDGPVEQRGVLATLSRWRSRVQIPSGPLRLALDGHSSRSGSSVGMSVRLKSGRSTVRSCP
jgi:hypothetical protein